MRNLSIIIILTILAISCKRPVPAQLSIRWNESPKPAEVDYALESNWASLPNRFDAADLLPKKSALKDEQANAPADVFFIHPTILTYPQRMNINGMLLSQIPI